MICQNVDLLRGRTMLSLKLGMVGLKILVGLKMAVHTCNMEFTTHVFISKRNQNLPRVDSLLVSLFSG